jgi:hypothetical protein
MAAALSASDASTAARVRERATEFGLLCNAASTGLKLQLVLKLLAGFDEDGHRGVAAGGGGG